jgi:hypothetical protein
MIVEVLIVFLEVVRLIAETVRVSAKKNIKTIVII